MDLYFSPLACSMATRIAVYEAAGDAAFVEVDPKTKRVLQDDSDFRAINPLGLVPALRTDDSVILTENAAILQYVADRFPEADVAAQSGIERSRLQQWLCFIGTELHKGLFATQLDPKAPPETKAYVLQKGLSRLDHVNKHLQGRDYLLDRFSVADAYLFTVLNWTIAIPAIDLSKWPALKSYQERIGQRASVKRAVAEEFALYKSEQARHRAA